MDNKTKEIWQDVLPLLEKELTILSYDVWIKTLDAAGVTDGRLVLAATGEAAADFVRTRYYDLIKRALLMTEWGLSDVEIVSSDKLRDMPYIEIATPKDAAQEEVRPQEPISINPRYNFENFVVGKSNRLAYTAARAVAEEPGTRYNPLFIYGGAGLGKTHLMHAAGSYIKLSRPDLRILFVTSEKFVNDLVTHIGIGHKSSTFREKYRGADVLMVDDIQFIAGKTATTEEIFHTFNELYDTNKQLIFTSDRFPKDIPDIDERLRSRFEWGFTADIQPPDLETRIAILHKKAQALKHNVPMEVLSAMAEAEGVKDNVRKMEGLLNKVLMLAQLENSPPSIELVVEAAKDYGATEMGILSAEDIIDATCRLFGVKKSDLIGKKKNREIVEPRQLCIYCITELLNMPLAAIGKLFGGRDHTTVLYARDKIIERLRDNAKTRVDVENIRNMVNKR
ncbi:MAG: chromosomal replication initiator protein DnaA [Firmicutes bacterium]|nr:chromosomal replication initiator protein DnaA [Bacillota bacterium]